MGLRIMLVCGGGFSSGFVAQTIRKAAKKQKMEIDVFAGGEGEIRDNINDVDALLVGPHLSYVLQNNDILETAKKRDITLMLISSEDYGTMDGETILKKAIEKIEQLRSGKNEKNRCLDV